MGFDDHLVTDLLFIVSGLALLAIGAESLVRGSAALALRLGVTALMVGLTVVALGTSSPELVLSIQAAAAGDSGIALGNVVGSNISNIALVLGVAALIKPLHVRSELIRREMPLMISVTLVLVALLLDGMLSRLDGSLLVAGAVTYVLFSYVVARRGESRAITVEFSRALESPRRAVWRDVVLIAAGLAALITGANLLLRGAVSLAAGLGISPVVIGLTVIAIGTSLPELATSITSALRGEADVTFGNVIGSNVLNILAVLGIAALIHPFRVVGLRTLDLGVMIGSAVLLLPLMWRGSVLNRWEGAALVAGYAAYLLSLVR